MLILCLQTSYLQIYWSICDFLSKSFYMILQQNYSSKMEYVQNKGKNEKINFFQKLCVQKIINWDFLNYHSNPLLNMCTLFLVHFFIVRLCFGPDVQNVTIWHEMNDNLMKYIVDNEHRHKKFRVRAHN